MKALLAALSFVMAIGCSPQARLSHLIKNHPELAKRDTLTRVDTIIIAPASTDTLIYYKQTDTVIVKENGVTVKYFYNTRDSTVYIRGDRDTTIIIREVPVIVNTFEAKPETRWQKLIRHAKDFLIPVLLGAVLVMLYLKRKRLPI